MAIIAVSFRIERDESSDEYNRRYKAITEKIKSYAVGSIWDETTSFYLFESNETAGNIASGVYLLTEFRTDKELLLVINTSSRTDHSFKGAVKYPTTLNNLLDKR